MSGFQHLLSLAAVLVGLALSNLAASLHHLLRERHRVHWDWLSPAAALLSVLLIVQFWFAFYDFGRASIFTWFGPVLLLLLELLQVVLMACVALPDDASELDLRRYYAEQSRYFWLVASSYVMGTMAWSLLLAPPQPLTGRLLSLLPDIVNFIMFMALALLRSRRLHELLVPLVCVYFMIGFASLRLQ
jgi:hypothetical protein